MSSLLRDKLSLFTLILGFAALISFFLPWADQVFGLAMFPWIRYYGYSLPFPNNFLIVVSGALLIALSITSTKLGILFRGIGTAFSGVALIPPMYFVMSLPIHLPPPLRGGDLFEPAHGFYVGATLCILMITLAVYSIFNWKPAFLAIFLGLASTLTTYVYSVQQEFEHYIPSFIRIDHGYPYPWFRYVNWLGNAYLYKNYSTFISFNFVFDLVLWFTTAWLFICVLSSLIMIRHRAHAESY